jgi:adenylate cyclase
MAGVLEPWELLAYDWSLRTRPSVRALDSRIVLIGITEEDIQAMGRWPLTDAMLAQVLDTLLQHQPRAIGVDIYRDIPVPPGQKALEPILAAHANIIMVMKFGRDAHARVNPPAVLRGTDQVGFNDLLVDRDGIVRRGLLFMDEGAESASSFALRLAVQYLQPEGITPQPDSVNPQHLRLGQTTFRPLEPNDGGYVEVDARGYQVLLDYVGASRPVPSYPLSALLSGQIAREAIRDKVVFVGVTATSVPDVFHIPDSSGLVGDHGTVYGVRIHAAMVNQLLGAALDGLSPLSTLSEPQETLWILMWGLLGGLIGYLGRSTWRFLVLTISGLGLLGLIVQTAMMRGWWIPLIPPALAWLMAVALITAYLMSREKKERAVLMQLFSKHVSPEVAETIWQQRHQFWEGGRPRSQKVMVTVLFSDLEGFTSVSEKMDAQALLDWTNAYIEVMAEVVMKHGGIVDDYFGDAIKANFGVPLARTSEAEIRQDAMNAVNCALAMEREMMRINELWQQQHLPTARMRIGIFTGPAVAGSLGSAQRLKYTTIGDSVNIAARLESFVKDTWEPHPGESPCRILIGESTLRYLDQQFRTQRLGELSLKGKQEKVTVYRLFGRAEQCGGDATKEDRMNSSKLTATISILTLVLGSVVPALGAEQQSQKPMTQVEEKQKKATSTMVAPVYKPPLRGAPGGRLGGGTRGRDQTFTLSVLAPNHTGLTVQEQPVLYWYLSKPITSPIEFTLMGDGIKPMLETTLKPPFEAGVQRLRLADFGVHLNPGKPYQWFVALVVDPQRRSKDILAGGAIERSEFSESAAVKLSRADKEEAARIYAEEGFWYDAVAAITERIEKAPKDISLREQRASLLQQVGLAEVSDYDLNVRAGK